MTIETPITPEPLRDKITYCVIAIAPLFALQAIPSPGIFRLGFALPLVYLVVAFARSSGAQLPVWSLLFIAWSALSVLWSDDPNYSALTLRTLLPIQLAFVLAVALSRSTDVLSAIRRSFAVIVGLSLLFLLLLPASRVSTGSESIHAQFPKNGYAIILGFTLVLLLMRRRPTNYVYIPLIAILIVLNYSVTAWLVSLILVVLVVAGRWILARTSPREGVPLLLLLGATLTLGAFTLIRALGSGALAVVGKDPTLSERTEIWAASWAQIQHAPFLGHGVGTFLNSASNSPVTQAVWLGFTQYLPPHPHNGLLDLWGQFGIVGVILFVGLVARGVTSALPPALAGSRPAITALLGLAFVILFGIAEPTFTGYYSILTFFCVGMAEQAARENREMAAEKRVLSMAGHPR